MAFAAAAVVGARRGVMQARSMMPSRNAPFSGYLNGANIATGISTCACTVLLVAGMVALIRSFGNTRAALIADYAKTVDEWGNSSRAEFAAASDLQVTAQWAKWATGDVAQRTKGVRGATEQEKDFRDTESGKDLASYTPLKYVTGFTFGSYQQQPNASAWDQLPPRDQAPTVIFSFMLRNRNGSETVLQTSPLPLAYDEVIRARAPSSDAKCKQQQSGYWQDRRCHVVRRLTEICVQVEQDDNGVWQFGNQNPTAPVAQPVADGGDDDENGTSAAAGPPATYGCDAGAGWDPALYVVDRCWVPRPWGPDPCDPTLPQSVTVTVRSARDPYIHAQELTNSTLDFGISRLSQRIYGWTMIGIGLYLCIMPILRIRDLLKARKRWGSSRSGSFPRTTCEMPGSRVVGQIQPA